MSRDIWNAEIFFMARAKAEFESIGSRIKIRWRLGFKYVEILLSSILDALSAAAMKKNDDVGD